MVKALKPQSRIRLATLNDIPAIARVQVDTWRTTYAGIIPDDYLAALDYGQRERVWQSIVGDTSNYFIHVVEVTEANETDMASRAIVGFAAAGRDRSGNPVYQGELTAIYILQACQHCGMGRQLVGAVAACLAQMGIHSMQVWVLEANPACQFYERLGGQRVGTKEIAIGGTCLVEVAYGWADTVGLRNAV